MYARNPRSRKIRTQKSDLRQRHLKPERAMFLGLNVFLLFVDFYYRLFVLA